MLKTTLGVLTALVLVTGVTVARPDVDHAQIKAHAQGATTQLASRAGTNDTGSEGHIG
jgi:hypothetical protein